MSKYDNLTQEELLKLVEEQEKKLKNPKQYGLVWDSEREPEQVVLDCVNNLPVLKRIKSKEIKTDKNEDNILIEGDNYHALTVLNYTHKEKIDVIYIDPPYNTGAKDWKYNNNFVTDEDGYRHSKWLNMMEKRLNLAQELLKEDGIICVTIDDYELRTLWMLMDRIFGEKNHLGTIVIRNNPAGRSTVRGISITHEYALFFGRSNNTQVGRLKRTESQIARYDERDDIGAFEWVNFRKPGSMRRESPKMFYPIFASEKLVRIPKMKWSEEKASWELLEKTSKGEKIIYPIDDNNQERRWRWGTERIKTNLHELKPQIKNDKLHIYVKGRINEAGVLPMTWWDKKEYSATAYGTNLLKEMFAELQIFSYPKSIFAVKDCLRVMNADRNVVVLDFFAGSGTTGHAVLNLNKEDGGNRKFILCTNNENNIATEVCYPRIKKVIRGYNKNGAGEKVEGLGGNLQYFKTSLIKKTKNKDQAKINLTQKCTEMLCVKENIFNLEKEGQDYKIFSSNRKDKFLCVYYNFLSDSFDNFLKSIKKLKGDKIIYMFSVNNKVDRKLFVGLDDFVIEAIPQKILDVYKQLVKMNIPVKTDVIFLELGKAKVEIFNEKEKDAGARRLRIVLENLIQKVAQNNGVNILNDKGKEVKISVLNDKLKDDGVFSKVDWEENRTYLAIGNYASHGDYDEYDMKQVENFYKHIQSLLNIFNV